MSKQNNSVPRIVAVATTIAAAQKRQTEICRRREVLLAELARLEVESSRLLSTQSTLSREMDKLTASSSVLP